MWQMALSMKIFGVSEISLRLPSVVMGTLMILLLYRITFLLTRKKIIALVASLFLCFSQFHLEMIAGIQGMDHNDVALGFYVLCSVWAYTEYNRTQKWYWAVLMGLFAGCAILNKWLLGLFVFLIWGINILVSILKSRPFKKESIHFILALLVCGVVFIPWQIYILQKWPAEANYVYEYNRRHISEVLQGHEGPFWYYLKYIHVLLSKLWFLILAGIGFGFFRKYINKKLLIAFCAGIFFVMFFFSFIVKTKVITYVFFVAPYCMALMSIGAYELILRFKKWFITFPVIIAIAYYSLKPEKFINYYSSENKEREKKIYNTKIYKNIREYLPKEYAIVLNVNSFEDTELMFYQNDITAYHWWIPEADLKNLERKKVPVAVFMNRGEYNIPDFVARYPYLFTIRKELR